MVVVLTAVTADIGWGFPIAGFSSDTILMVDAKMFASILDESTVSGRLDGDGSVTPGGAGSGSICYIKKNL